MGVGLAESFFLLCTEATAVIVEMQFDNAPTTGKNVDISSDTSNNGDTLIPDFSDINASVGLDSQVDMGDKGLSFAATMWKNEVIFAKPDSTTDMPDLSGINIMVGMDSLVDEGSKIWAATTMQKNVYIFAKPTQK